MDEQDDLTPRFKSIIKCLTIIKNLPEDTGVIKCPICNNLLHSV
jgi:hypothetical protein